MAKEFKTIDQLVELMESRGIVTDDKTATAIKRESYYAIINGYKAPFLDREAMKSSAEDVYLEGTTFQQIYDLFMFDRRLRESTFPYLTAAESALKNAVVYAFCEKNRDAEAYLERSNYTPARDMLVPKSYQGNKAEEHATNMANLMKILNGKNKHGQPHEDSERKAHQQEEDAPLREALSKQLRKGSSLGSSE